MTSKDAIDDFFLSNEMHYNNIDFMEVYDAFVLEMENGLVGTDSSLRMLPTYICVDDEMKLLNKIRNQKVISIDMGGSNLRVSVVSFDNYGRASITYFRNVPIPGAKDDISKDAFFDNITEMLAPVIGESTKIGFCFSYAVDMLPNRDGVLIAWSKGISIKDVEGEHICECLISSLKKRGIYSGHSVVLTNDSAAVLLAGKVLSMPKKYNGYIGFILGTGINSAYEENIVNIKKMNDLNNGKKGMIINIESCRFNSLHTGKFDNILDMETNNPGEQRLEKMVSGAYLGKLTYIAICNATKIGLLNGIDTKKLESLSTKDINEFMINPYGDNLLSRSCSKDDEREKLYHISNILITRAAKLVAINLAAIMKKVHAGVNPCLPVCIAAEGTTFYSSWILRHKLYYFVETYLNNALGMYCDIIRAENMTVVGTAVSALI